MKLKDLINKYDLHDSLVERVENSPGTETIEIYVELCNWRQPSYIVGEPEVICCKLVFSGVINYTINPTSTAFDSEEILDVTILNDITDNVEILKMVIRGSEDVKVLTIQAEDVELFIDVI